jgi:hypothetical protein
MNGGEDAFLRAGRVDYDAIARAGLDPERLGEALSKAWAGEYDLVVPDAELVEITLGTLTYLFDITESRTLGVYGRSAPTGAPRPATRMRGHPSYNRPGRPATDRGHLAAHSLGGGADLNLVAQNHLLNVSGEWRNLERYAQQHPGTFFAVHARYENDDDRPTSFVYALIREGQLHTRAFDNDAPS